MRDGAEQSQPAPSLRSSPLILDEHSIALADLLAGVGDERDVDLAAEPSVHFGRAHPRQMRVVAVGRDGENLRVKRSELLVCGGERKNLSRAHELSRDRQETGAEPGGEGCELKWRAAAKGEANAAQPAH